MAYNAVNSKAVVLLLLIHCLLLLSLFVGIICVLSFSTLWPSSFAITLMGKREHGGFLTIVMFSSQRNNLIKLTHYDDTKKIIFLSLFQSNL